MKTIQEIAAKPTLDENDINFLMQHRASLPQSVLERLGLVPPTPVSVGVEPVKVEEVNIKTVSSGAVIIDPPQTTVVKPRRGRNARVI